MRTTSNDRPGAPADPGDPARIRLSAEASASQGRDHLWFRTESPLGTVFVAHCDGWVSGLRIATDSTWAAHVEAKLPSWTPVDTGSFATFMRNTDIMHKRLRVEVRADPDPDPEFVEMVRCALAEGRTDVPVDLSSLAGELDQAALRAATRIRRGETLSYGELAELAGWTRRSARAVGNAMMKNPVPLLIPCHRVIRGDGTLGQWGFGRSLKQQLLDSEGVCRTRPSRGVCGPATSNQPMSRQATAAEKARPNGPFR